MFGQLACPVNSQFIALTEARHYSTTCSCTQALCRYKPHWNIELRLRPLFLGGVFQAQRQDSKPPSLNPKKGQYSQIDVPRCARFFDVPFTFPKNFWEVIVTKGTLKPQRFITAVSMTHPDFTEQLSRELWKRIYEYDLDATEPASLKEAALSAGMSQAVIEEALGRMQSAEVKEKLKATTQEALDQGCFGAPFMVVHYEGKKENFFGSDRLPVLAMVIGETWQGPNPGQSSKL